MARISFINADGDEVYASAANPLPTSGSGGGGLQPTDITATLPAQWDNTTNTISVKVNTTSDSVCAGNDSRLSNSRTPTGAAGGDLTGSYPNPTIGPGKVTVAQLATATQAKLITQQSAIADLTADPTVDDFNGLLAALRAAGVIAS